MNKSIDFYEFYLDLKSKNIPSVVVTMTGARGSAPQDVGAKMIVTSKGNIFGTVGGGKIEAHAIRLSQDYLNEKNNKSIAHTWNLQKDIGMTCGGEVTFFFEVESDIAPWDITIFGAGHVSQELTKILLMLNCSLTVIDNRQEWLDKLPESNYRFKKIFNTNMSEEVKNLNPKSFVASMTMGHSLDTPILYEALKSHSFPYLGVIGSKPKRNTIEKELIEQGVDEYRAKEFLCPIGEDIGTNDPAEIAISISAQLLKHRDLLSL